VRLLLTVPAAQKKPHVGSNRFLRVVKKRFEPT